MTDKKKARLFIEITILIFLVFVVRFWLQRDVVKGIAPDINHAMLNGGYFELYASHKKPVLVHFWASWCPVCKLEQSSISAIAKDYPVITIAMQSGDDAEIKQYMKNEKLFFPVINDRNGTLSHRYGIKGVPVSLVINKKNNIEFTEMGYTSEIGLRLRLWWAGL